MERLNLCHTQDDVEVALQGLPIGMEALYDRMASSIAQNPSASDRALASRILQCVTCSLRVLTVPELSQALSEDGTQLLDFQRSIVDLCGGFVTIDNGGNVAMIHQTAREYLLSEKVRLFHIKRKDAHKQLFLGCMRCLMAIGLRAKFNTKQEPEFLGYAASSWSSHLAFSSLDCEQVVKGINEFLTGNWVLTWIQILAARKQLRVLIHASKHLSIYSAKRKDYDVLRNKVDYLILNHELMRSWAEDFVKIVGKFGMILRRKPDSIYRLIPPFCPKNSAIYQQFGKTRDKSLLVSGLSMDNWDDSLTRISFGLHAFSSSISAAGAQIAVLVSSGNVFLYDSSVFEEASASPIKHGERIYRMQLNSTGTLLATYGYLTTQIWETSTGRCQISIENIGSRPRPLTILFTNNNTSLLVGTDDRRVRSLDLNQVPPTWKIVAELEEPELEGHFLNASNYMAISKDGRLIAVAYRGHPLSAWETDGPVHIGHCWRNREEIARGEVIEAVWHPHHPEVLGLYIEGVIFKWRPYDCEVEEIATGASRLSISSDGNLFATGDVRGTVKVYITSDFCLLYQLASEDTVLGLVFSPDLRRFYDIRGYYGNAWEPNALMRYAEQRGRDIEVGSEAESLVQSSAASESWSRRVDSITVLVCSPVGRLYCYGTENGVVLLCDTQKGKLADLHVSKSFLSIEQISWSKDGKYLCFSDSSKRVIIMSISPIEGHSIPTVETKAVLPLKDSLNGPILQLLFHSQSDQLLVRCSSTICTISLLSYSVTHSMEMPTAECKWITHPQDPTLTVGISPNNIHILSWNLAECRTYKFEYSQHRSLLLSQKGSPGLDTVEKVLVTQDSKHILVQMSLFNQSSREKMLLLFATSSCSNSAVTALELDQQSYPTAITPLVLPRYLSSQIAISLSFLSHDNLVFLSRTFEVCTWQLSALLGLRTPSPLSLPRSVTEITATADPSIPLNSHHVMDTNSAAGNEIKSLFPLPGDWISKDCLALCDLWSIERSFLCPKNGEIAVVRCAALV